MQPNPTRLGLINLLLLLAPGILGLVLARESGSLAGQAAMAFLGTGTLVAILAWFQMRLEERERLEKLELEELARSARGTTLFDTGDAEKVARGLLEDDKTKLVWNAPRVLLPKNKVKLILNMCQIAAAAIPRGGVVEATISGEGEAAALSARSSGAYFRLAQSVPQIDLFRRREAWRGASYFLEDDIQFESIGLTLPVRQIYRRVSYLDAARD